MVQPWCAGCVKDDSIEIIKSLSYGEVQFCPKAQRQKILSLTMSVVLCGVIFPTIPRYLFCYTDSREKPLGREKPFYYCLGGFD